MKRRLAYILGVTVGAMLLNGCTGAAANTSATDNTSIEGKMVDSDKSITLAQSANFAQGFSTNVHSYECTYYMNNWYDTLVEMKEGEFVPSLATDWSVSEDGLVYSFNLRQDVKFSDGTLFNAEAVKLYYDNMRPVLGASANYGQLDMYTEEITVDAEYKVSFHLKQPYFGVLKDLSMVLPRGIMSAAAFNQDGSVNSEYLMDHTAGTGPYMFESVNETATQYEFVSNPLYWGEKPDVETFTVKIIPDSKIAAMKTEEVDFIMGYETIDTASYEEISKWEGFKGVKSDIDCATEFISLNINVAPFDDIKVRHAIQQGIDKEVIVNNIYGGSKTVAPSILSTQLPYCGKVTDFVPEYAPEEAKALLEEAGYADTDGDGYREMNGEKLSFAITYPSNGAYDKTILAFQGNMKELGIEITTDPIDLMTYMDKVFTKGEYDMTAYITYWIPYDPYTIVANMYPSMDYTDPSGLFSTDPQITNVLTTMDKEEAKALIAGIYSTDDTGVIEEIYTKAINCANQSAVVLPIDYTNEYAVYNETVVASYTFNSIPNHVDVAEIKLK